MKDIFFYLFIKAMTALVKSTKMGIVAAELHYAALISIKNQENFRLLSRQPLLENAS